MSARIFHPSASRSASQVADQTPMVSLFASNRPLQPKCACRGTPGPSGECEACCKKRVQRKGNGIGAEAQNASAVPPLVYEVLRSPGHPLDAMTRDFFEPHFGHDFSRVRVHNDAQAAASSQAVNALAYTVGRDLVFAEGNYRPQRIEGKRLLAHELAHVVQQRSIADHPDLQHGLRLSDEDCPAEREADAMAERSFAQRPIQLPAQNFAANASQPVSVTTPTIQRRMNPQIEAKKADATAATPIFTEGCSSDQENEIFAATKGALAWLNHAIAKLDAYLIKPSDAGTKVARDVLQNVFKTTNVKVGIYVRGQLGNIQSDIKNLSTWTLECHDSSDKECTVAAAYTNYGKTRIVFCSSFFSGKGAATERQIETIVHEVAHGQVGGTQITDRAYESDRLYKQLTTEEALTNAESYGLLVQQVATGTVPSISADSYEDCPPEWEKALIKSLAVAQRWNREAQTLLATLTPEVAKGLSENDIKLIGGTTQAVLDSFREALNTLAAELQGTIDFECEPEGGGDCDKGLKTYWYPIGDLHICPQLLKEEPDAQVLGLLAGLYGYAADVEEITRQWNYATFAKSCAKETPPALSKILGSAAWTEDYLRIRFQPATPSSPSGGVYVETGTIHQRMSSDLPKYQGPPCQKATLPFRCQVLFLVDGRDVPRPAPFTPPRTRVTFQYMTPSGQYWIGDRDSRPVYNGPGFGLITNFEDIYGFDLVKNGPLTMKFELQDPDTSVTRVYEDTIQIEAERPCNTPKESPGKK